MIVQNSGDDGSGRSGRISQRTAVTVVYVLGLFVTIIDITIVNVALPQIGRQLQVSASQLSAVTVSYTVALAVIIPVSGWLGDRFGGAPVLLGAIGVFTVASALCGLAANLPQLIVFRSAQGLGGGVLIPVGLAMLYRVFPSAERIQVAGRTAVITGIAPVLGPVLGGVLVTQLSWRWVFFVNVPIGLAALLFGGLFLRRQPTTNPGRLDVLGLVLSGAGFASVMYGVSQGSQRGWGAGSVLIALGVGGVLLVLLVITQLRVTRPLLRLRLFADRLFRAINVVNFLGTATFFGLLYVIALYLQEVLGLSAQEAGFMMIAEAGAALLGAQLSSRVLYPRVGPRRLIRAGLTGLVLSATLMSVIASAHLPVVWLILLALLGLSWSQVFVLVSAEAFARISHEDTANASTLFSSLRQLGSALGIAGLAAVLAETDRSTTSAVNGSDFRLVFAAAALLAVLAVIATFAIHDRDATSTRERQKPKAGPVPPGHLEDQAIIGGFDKLNPP